MGTPTARTDFFAAIAALFQFAVRFFFFATITLCHITPQPRLVVFWGKPSNNISISHNIRRLPNMALPYLSCLFFCNNVADFAVSYYSYRPCINHSQSAKRHTSFQASYVSLPYHSCSASLRALRKVSANGDSLRKVTSVSSGCRSKAVTNILTVALSPLIVSWSLS